MHRRSVLWWLASAAWLAGWAYIGFPAALTETARRPFEWVPTTHRPRDIVFNFVYYVACGVLATQAGLRVAAVVVLAATLAATTELTQRYSTNRYPSSTDVIANTLGALAGAVILARLQRAKLPDGE